MPSCAARARNYVPSSLTCLVAPSSRSQLDLFCRSVPANHLIYNWRPLRYPNLTNNQLSDKEHFRIIENRYPDFVPLVLAICSTRPHTLFELKEMLKRGTVTEYTKVMDGTTKEWAESIAAKRS